MRRCRGSLPDGRNLSLALLREVVSELGQGALRREYTLPVVSLSSKERPPAQSAKSLKLPPPTERSERVGADAALVTYIAEVEIPGDPPIRAQFAVGEVWVKHRGAWLCRYYQGTLTK